jgi:glycosyltransferase involved in cell wall biosynthesis
MIGVIIPCFKVKKHILDVVSRVGPEVSRIYIVDDLCPQETGKYVQNNVSDLRVKCIFNKKNYGVGGAMKAGFQAAMDDRMEIIVKIDGDGQMDPGMISLFIKPILDDNADYTKGNRFYDLAYILKMPYLRILGNSMLSFMTKLSTGYWDIFDVNNGYVAIHANVLSHINLNKVSNRYFFESDMLYQIGLLRGKVMDIPMDSHYADEESNLKIKDIFIEFFLKHVRNFFSRLFYNYFLRDTSIASVGLVFGLVFSLFGTTIGVLAWVRAIQSLQPTPLGTIMLAVFPLLTGTNFLFLFINHDISSTPKNTIHTQLLLKHKS